MTPNDISRSSLLDLLFEHRNKLYGAYSLRRYYPRRLTLALGLTLLIAFGVLLLFSSGGGSRLRSRDSEKPPVTVLDLELPRPSPAKPLPVPTEAAARPRASERFLNNFRIVPDDERPDVPTVDQLAAADPGERDSEGEPSDGRPLPAAGPGPGPGSDPAPAPAAAPAPAPGPTTHPEFPGGLAAWNRFLSRNLVIPSEVQAGERRTVRVRFWVGEDGSITRFEVLASGGEACDEEVLRVLKKMPRWKPALQQGIPVATSFTQPVTFEVSEQ